ncbi:unnamed protein product [Lota lota]
MNRKNKLLNMRASLGPASVTPANGHQSVSQVTVERLVVGPPTTAKPPEQNPRFHRRVKFPDLAVAKERLAVAKKSAQQPSWLTSAQSTMSLRAKVLAADPAGQKGSRENLSVPNTNRIILPKIDRRGNL